MELCVATNSTRINFFLCFNKRFKKWLWDFYQSKWNLYITPSKHNIRILVLAVYENCVRKNNSHHYNFKNIFIMLYVPNSMEIQKWLVKIIKWCNYMCLVVCVDTNMCAADGPGPDGWRLWYTRGGWWRLLMHNGWEIIFFRSKYVCYYHLIYQGDVQWHNHMYYHMLSQIMEGTEPHCQAVLLTFFSSKSQIRRRGHLSCIPIPKPQTW